MPPITRQFNFETGVTECNKSDYWRPTVFRHCAYQRQPVCILYYCREGKIFGFETHRSRLLDLKRNPCTSQRTFYRLIGNKTCSYIFFMSTLKNTTRTLKECSNQHLILPNFFFFFCFNKLFWTIHFDAMNLFRTLSGCIVDILPVFQTLNLSSNWEPNLKKIIIKPT